MATQLDILKGLIPEEQNDVILQFYLDCASDIICDLRNATAVETKYLTAQIKIAVELYNKQGAEGQTGHSENGISRSYESADISPSLLRTITPIAKTPFSVPRIIV